MRRRRPPLAKEFFLEGNRQRWCLVFTIVGAAVMVASCTGTLKDPMPFLDYFAKVGVTFILGASATSLMNTYRMPKP
jgi:hypothetical protein